MLYLFLSIIVYCFLMISLESFVSGEIPSMFLHGLSLLISIAIGCLLKKRIIQLGDMAAKTTLIVIVGMVVYKSLIILFVLDFNPPERTILASIYLFFAISLVSISEELFFRGFLFDTVAAKYNQKAAIIASVVLFTLMHMSNSMIALAFNCVSGIIFVYLRVRYQGIFMSIIAHLVGNWTVFCFGLAYSKLL
ncbi:MAG: CPBP family intramembrane glutamic endopeptidase [Pseudomonadota bacterium]|nr:CPBP family intramembrane glutamic endopeptidase [Pseudomonadota bacterium]